jgi:predicted metal-dependent enzyme (double-stranded beta helix superfamily)
MTAPNPARPNLARLRDFVAAFTRLIDANPFEADVLDVGEALLRGLIVVDDWLPPAFAAADPARYRQHLLHCDPLERFSVVSFVWGPGQQTPVHDHTVWGLIGQLRGAEASQPYDRQDGKLIPVGPRLVLRPGQVEAVSPRIGDIHQVANAVDEVSISIHVYGGNIGAVRRSTYGADGAPQTFISGYSNAETPNLWDRSAELRAEALA